MERGEYAFVFCRFSHCDINYHGPSDAVLGSKAKPFQQLYWCGPFLCFYIHHEILESSVYYQVSVSISQYFLIHFFVDVLSSFFYVPWRLSIERQDASAPSWRCEPHNWLQIEIVVEKSYYEVLLHHYLEVFFILEISKFTIAIIYLLTHCTKVIYRREIMKYLVLRAKNNSTAILRVEWRER